MIGSIFMVINIEWDVTVQEAVDYLYDLGESAFGAFEIPDGWIEYGEWENVYNYILDNPQLRFDIFDLPTEIELDPESFDFYGNPDELDEEINKYLEDTYGFLVDHFELLIDDRRVI